MNTHPELAETNVTLAGRESVRVTPVAGPGPLLVTVSVYVRNLPAVTGSGASVFVIDKSAGRMTVVLAVAVLFAVLGSTSLAVTLAVLVIVPA